MNIIEANKRRVSVSKSHSYTKENVLLAEQFLVEYGKNQRHIDPVKVLEAYNAIKGTSVQAGACKSCGFSKYIIGIQNYAKYGRMVLENEGVDLDEKVEPVRVTEEISEERIDTGIVEEISEEPVKENKSVKTKKSNAKSKNK